MNSKGKVIIVTGSSRGIGAAIGKAFAAEGGTVIINYIQNKEAADEVVKACKELGGDASAIKANVTSSKEVQDMVSCVLGDFGKIDVIVNNAFKRLSLRRQFRVGASGRAETRADGHRRVVCLETADKRPHRDELAINKQPHALPIAYARHMVPLVKRYGNLMRPPPLGNQHQLAAVSRRAHSQIVDARISPALGDDGHAVPNRIFRLDPCLDGITFCQVQVRLNPAVDMVAKPIELESFSFSSINPACSNNFSFKISHGTESHITSALIKGP